MMRLLEDGPENGPVGLAEVVELESLEAYLA